jgi:hypothetical protein
LFSERNHGSNCNPQWLADTIDIFTNLIVVDHGDITISGKAGVFTFELATKFQLRLFEPLVTDGLPCLFDITCRDALGDLISGRQDALSFFQVPHESLIQSGVQLRC